MASLIDCFLLGNSTSGKAWCLVGVIRRQVRPCPLRCRMRK